MGRNTKIQSICGKRKSGCGVNSVSCPDGRKQKAISCKSTRYVAGPNFHHQECYNGIWACASLLHLPVESQHKVVDEFLKALSPNGVLYASWKYGSETYSQDGRFFCDMTPVTLREFFEKHPDINILKLWETPDFQKRKNWVNILVQKTV